MDEEVRAALRRPTCSVDQVAGLLGLSRPTVIEAIERGDITGQKLGRKWVIPTAPLRKLLKVEDVQADQQADPT